MAYSIHGNISYNLEWNSKMPDGFSLIGRKPNQILQYKWDRFIALKCKPKIKLKFILKVSKTIKIMKDSETEED